VTEAHLEPPLKPEFELKSFEFSGEPYERGFSYGAACRDGISRFLQESFYDVFSLGETIEASKEQMALFAKKCTPYIEAYSPEIFEQMKGIADGSGRTLEEIALIFLHEESRVLGEEELMRHCTVIAATGAATVGGETYVSQNWDESYEDFWGGDKPLLLYEERRSGPNVLAWSYPGLLAAAGMNSEGLSVTWTSTPRAPFEVGVPTYVIVAEILRKTNIVEALEAVIKAKRAGSFKLTVADENGEIYVVEATPRHHHLIYVTESYGYHADFESAEIRYEISPHKVDVPFFVVPANRVRKLLKTAHGKLDMSVIRDILCDEYICCHPTLEEERWTDCITWASWTMVPSKREWWIAHGPPCQNEPRRFAVA
jgi:isopenicillin-N N-acyltransferase-like protein